METGNKATCLNQCSLYYIGLTFGCISSFPRGLGDSYGDDFYPHSSGFY